MPKKILHKILNLAGLLGRINTFDEIINLVVRETQHMLDSETAFLLMLNPQTRKTCKTIMSQGHLPSSRARRHAVQQISGWLIIHKTPLLVEEPNGDNRFPSKVLQPAGIKTVIGAPLLVEGTIIGTLIAINTSSGKPFSTEDARQLGQIASIAAPHLRNMQQLQAYFEAPQPREALLTKYQQAGLFGKSEKFVLLIQSVEAAARTNVRVLLEGPSGSGKELVAHAIHMFSNRANGPFIAIDCGAIPAHLIESELFGHARGAFTGAVKDRQGLLEVANNGTLFLDEISNLPLDMQAKLLRVLQDGQIRRVGSNTSKAVDIRIVAASSAPLKERLDGQSFRQDLYFRLNVYPIRVPSLSERVEDIPLLANRFLRQFAGQQEKQITRFHEAVLEMFCCRPWHGNIRELSNIVERLVTLAPETADAISYELLPEELLAALPRKNGISPPHSYEKSLEEKLRDCEIHLIREALRRTDGNKSQAARLLKIPTPTLRYKMRKLGL